MYDDALRSTSKCSAAKSKVIAVQGLLALLT